MALTSNAEATINVDSDLSASFTTNTGIAPIDNFLNTHTNSTIPITFRDRNFLEKVNRNIPVPENWTDDTRDRTLRHTIQNGQGSSVSLTEGPNGKVIKYTYPTKPDDSTTTTEASVTLADPENITIRKQTVKLLGTDVPAGDEFIATVGDQLRDISARIPGIGDVAHVVLAGTSTDSSLNGNLLSPDDEAFSKNYNKPNNINHNTDS